MFREGLYDFLTGKEYVGDLERYRIGNTFDREEGCVESEGYRFTISR